MITSNSYFVAVTTLQDTPEVVLALANTGGTGSLVMGFSAGSFSTNLWIFQNAKRSSNHVRAQLQGLPAVQHLAIVDLSNPVREVELAEVRQLFSGIGWDSSLVDNHDLAIFLHSRLKGEYLYYIDHQPGSNPSAKIQIRRLEDHPHYSPEWGKVTVNTTAEPADRELTLDDWRLFQLFSQM